MKKSSFYNHYVDYGKYFIYYNSYSDSYLLLNNALNQLYLKYKENINNLKNENIEFYNKLIEGNFLVDKNLDEKNIVLNYKIKQKSSTTEYNVFINPTLDCNLGCWYCYESHKKNSVMSPQVANSIVKNITKKFIEQPFKTLSIGFFGGEPLLKMRTVVIPLINEIGEFAVKNRIILRFNITTNGTLISDLLLSTLKPYNVFFQITIDGNEELHNKVRCFKNQSKKKSFQIILTNLKKIQNSLDNYSIGLRINYDKNTLDNISDIIDSLSFLDSKKVSISFVKIWQVKPEEIQKEKLINALNYTARNNFTPNYFCLRNSGVTCYADKQNQLLVNYDGLIYKCTAEDFNSKNKEGVLLENGVVNWDMNKYSIRMKLQTPVMCKNCKLLPSCPGICSRKLIKAKDSIVNKCPLVNNLLTLDEIIALNFKRTQLKEKLEI